jgi:hypothetical protein
VVTAPRGNTAANQSYTHSIENSMNKVFMWGHHCVSWTKKAVSTPRSKFKKFWI